MPYQKPSVQTERTGLPGTPLGNTSFFIPLAIAKTLGKETNMSRTAEVSGDLENIYVNGVMVAVGDTLNYERVTYNSGTKLTTALQRLPIQSILTVSTDHTNPYKREFVEGLDFTVNKTTGVLNFVNAPVVPNVELDGVVTDATGGAIAAGTYNVAVMAVDAIGNADLTRVTNLTLASTGTITTTGSLSSITIRWGKVTNAAGYAVYVKTSAGTSAQYALATGGAITSGTTTSLTLTVTPVNGSLSLPTSNGTQHTPNTGDYVYINYTYMVYNYNSPKRYFDTEVLQQDHGIGSELANAGRLILGPAGVGAAGGSMYAVAPEVSNGEIIGYQDAISSCESVQELLLLATSSSSDTVNETLVAHCQDMSTPTNARERFCFVSTTSAIQADTDVSKITAKILALNGSNRCIFVVTDGGHPHIDNWQNTPALLNVIDGATKTTSYTPDLPVDGQWHAIAMMGQVAALPDPATPPTNKQVYGISSGEAGTVQLWNDTRKNAIATVGGTILEDQNNNLMVRHALTISQASVEDSEVSIVLAEAYMARRLRDAHKQYIGKKLTNNLLAGVAGTSKKVLDGLVQDEIIRSYTPVNVYQDTVNPTKVNIKYNYNPIYPTNTLKFEWGFDIAG